MAALAFPVSNGPVLDAVDLALIAELRRDGRLTHEELSRRVSLSRPAVVQRMKRLREVGAILGYTTVIDWDLVGLPVLAFIRVRTSGQCRDVARQVMELSGESIVIEECHRITGEWCFMLKIRAKSSSAVEVFLDRMRDEAPVLATMTTLALSTVYPAETGHGHSARGGDREDAGSTYS